MLNVFKVHCEKLKLQQDKCVKIVSVCFKKCTRVDKYYLSFRNVILL